MLNGVGEEGEDDGRREQNRGMSTNVICLVFAEHLVCQLH